MAHAPFLPWNLGDKGKLKKKKRYKEYKIYWYVLNLSEVTLFVFVIVVAAAGLLAARIKVTKFFTINYYLIWKIMECHVP